MIQTNIFGRFWSFIEAIGITALSVWKANKGAKLFW